jgi:hypothetical protein
LSSSQSWPKICHWSSICAEQQQLAHAVVNPSKLSTGDGILRTFGCVITSLLLDRLLPVAELSIVLLQGVQPLLQLEVVDLSSITSPSSGSNGSNGSSSISWQTPVATGPSPNPRGQPSVAANTSGTSIFLFGGWDGEQLYNDLYRLHVPQQYHPQWRWELVEAAHTAVPPAALGGATHDAQFTAAAATELKTDSSAAPAVEAAASVGSVAPCPRADHSLVRNSWQTKRIITYTLSNACDVGNSHTLECRSACVSTGQSFLLKHKTIPCCWALTLHWQLSGLSLSPALICSDDKQSSVAAVVCLP